MQIHASLIVASLSLVTASCGEADASAVDASNPVACALQFQVYSKLMRDMGDVRVADAFHNEAKWYAAQAAKLPANQRSSEVIDKLSERMASDPDRSKAVGRECLERLKEDPQIRAALEERMNG